jgi:AraC-like DNA-binding protein
MFIYLNNKSNFHSFSVTTVGFQSIQPNTAYPLKDYPEGYLFNSKNGQILSEYQLIYITKGSGILKIDSTETLPIDAGQIVLIRPNQLHCYCPNIDSGWDEYYIGFCGDILKNVFGDSVSILENQIVDLGLNAELVDLFRRAIYISKSDKMSLQECLKGTVLHIIGLILSEAQRNNITNEFSHQIVEKAKIIMGESIFTNLSPVELALKLEMNYVSFRKLFKETTGFAPAKYLMELKMQKAKELLLKSSHSINKISSDLSFDSPDSFNKAFKKNTGQTGTKYRSTHKRVSK